MRTIVKQVLCIVLLSMCVAPAFAEQQCRLPAQLQPWDYNSSKAIKHGKDWQNSSTTTDYWMLSLSWSKAYCEKFKSGRIPAHARHQCVNNEFGLVVHGLWAQSAVAGKNTKAHPRNCQDVSAIPASEIEKYLCEIPGTRLMQMQWEKHGTCDFDNASHYLSKTRQLFRQLNLPSRKMLENMEYSSWKNIKRKIIEMNRPSGLRNEHVYVKFRKKRLHEIYICYDLDYRYTACR